MGLKRCDMGRKKSEKSLTGYEINKRWRQKHPEARCTGKKRYYDKTRDSMNRYERYTEEEKEMIIAHDIPDSELAEKIGRGVAAIQGMRAKLKKESWNE